MAKLFQCSADNISLHLKIIYEEGELSQEATTEEFSIVRQEGPRNAKRGIAFYNITTSKQPTVFSPYTIFKNYFYKREIDRMQKKFPA